MNSVLRRKIRPCGASILLPFEFKCLRTTMRGNRIVIDDRLMGDLVEVFGFQSAKNVNHRMYMVCVLDEGGGVLRRTMIPHKGLSFTVTSLAIGEIVRRVGLPHPVVVPRLPMRLHFPDRPTWAFGFGTANGLTYLAVLSRAYRRDNRYRWLMTVLGETRVTTIPNQRGRWSIRTAATALMKLSEHVETAPPHVGLGPHPLAPSWPWGPWGDRTPTAESARVLAGYCRDEY